MAGSGKVLEVDDASFDTEVLSAKLPVLVEFVGAWCAPCRTMAPVVERLAAETRGRVKVVAIDTDASPEVAKRFRIRGVPTVAVFRGGKKTAEHLGATTRERLLELLEG